MHGIDSLICVKYSTLTPTKRIDATAFILCTKSTFKCKYNTSIAFYTNKNILLRKVRMYQSREPLEKLKDSVCNIVQSLKYCLKSIPLFVSNSF